MFASPPRSAAILVLTALLAACAGQEPALRKPREAWRGKTEAACIKSGLVRESSYVKRVRALNGPGPCGTRKPFIVSAALDGQVALDPPATLTCNMVPVFDRWLARDVQPSADTYLGDHVTGVEVAASYGCRTRNTKRGAKISEHSFANAIDIKAFLLASGRRISVENGWNGSPQDALFLRSVHRGGCSHFKTIIGPEGDRHHRDHFHFDLAWHGKDGQYVHCE
jgi:hypothetical protein